MNVVNEELFSTFEQSCRERVVRKFVDEVCDKELFHSLLISMR